MPHQLTKYCFVPWCESSSLCSPGKKFITVPKCEAERKKWFQVVGLPKQSFFKTFYCCEDHFDVNTDFEKWSKFHLLYGSTQFMLKKGVVPHLALIPKENPSSPKTDKPPKKTSHGAYIENDIVIIDDSNDKERPDQDQASTGPFVLDQNSTSMSHENINHLNEPMINITVNEDSASNYQPNQTESVSEEYIEATDMSEVEVVTTIETHTEPQTKARSLSSKIRYQKASYNMGKKGNESPKLQQDQPVKLSQKHIGVLLANGHVLPSRPEWNESDIIANENGGVKSDLQLKDHTTTSPSNNPDSESDNNAEALIHFKQAYNYCPYTNCQYHAPSRKGLKRHLKAVHLGKTKYEKCVPVGCTILEETVHERNMFQAYETSTCYESDCVCSYPDPETSTCYKSDCVCSYPDPNSDGDDDDECEMYISQHRMKYSCPYPECKYYTLTLRALQRHINVIHFRNSSISRKKKSRPFKKVKTVLGLPTYSPPSRQPIIPNSTLVNEDNQNTNFNISDQIICETGEFEMVAAEEIVVT